MIKAHRLPTAVVVIVCVLATSSQILFAAENTTSSRAGSASPSTDSLTTAKEDVSTIPGAALSGAERLPGTSEFVRSLTGPSPLLLGDNRLNARSLVFRPAEPNVFAQRGYGGRRYSGRNNNGAAAAIIVGAAAAIAGTALLVYANRPECSTRPTAGGCGYGAKVLGGAVLTGGVVGVTVGALTWR